MKVAHFAIVTPKLCGLYETTRELVVGLRAKGIDSRIFDPKPRGKFKGMKEDRGAIMADEEWAKDADILVSHSGLGDAEDWGKPMIYALHGRPRCSFVTEKTGGTPVYSHHYNSNAKSNLKAVVTFWPEHRPYLEVMYPDKPVHVVQSPVDLDFWKPGTSTYNFSGKAGDTNIICVEGRGNEDTDSYGPLNAYALWARKNQHLKPKLHMFGTLKDMKGWGALIRRIQDDGNMGLVQGWVEGLEHVYRAADCLLTPHTINVRTVREARACGCPVVRIRDIVDSGITNALSEIRTQVRLKAVQLYNPETTAQQFKDILCSY